MRPRCSMSCLNRDLFGDECFFDFYGSKMHSDGRKFGNRCPIVRTTRNYSRANYFQAVYCFYVSHHVCSLYLMGGQSFGHNRTGETRNCTNTIRKSHQNTGISWRNIQVIHIEPCKTSAYPKVKGLFAAVLPDMANPLKPTAIINDVIAAPWLREYATTMRKMASPPKPGKLNRLFLVIFAVQDEFKQTSAIKNFADCCSAPVSSSQPVCQHPAKWYYDWHQ